MTSSSSATTTPNSGSSRRRRKLFSIGPLRFRCCSRREECMDTLMDRLSWAVEGLVYLIGPLLIILALCIISLLTYSFTTILLPMIYSKHQGSSLRFLHVGLHCCWVLFLLTNVLFNYFLCVTTRNVGPNYDKVVRELAEATDMAYPETPVQLEQYRRGFEDRMVLRMRRRQQQARTADTPTTSDQSNGVVTHRKVPPSALTSTTAVITTLPPPAPAPPRPRQWMLLGPLEWGYCGFSQQPKPPRSHYDHVTKSLVLNMDHYCPWMFNVSE